ncbi:hypothetical protein L0664_06670 [Octadecabacter sp. G9-8]|uniref:Uncharacterized protein n=1 Tax=Octadecabacter dasysiphoniae TaxID=2909341 RepID=A0ABS9CU28_9RHOB|nr:hypothetical protein [Octadecabacter dasysiphoniae]MCF2870745.1 hypothetical protein [Octadecabacter dasysiphoniae]
MTFIVRDLDKMEAFLTQVFDASYFYDHDNHMFELHCATLDDRSRTYARKATR